MISLNDTHPAPKPVESYRVRKEAMDAAVFVIGPHARHGFEYETSKVDGRWIWRHTDEVRPDTPAELKANGGKKSLMLASTPMAHVGAAKPVKLPVPPRRMAPSAPWKPAGAPDGGAGGEQPPSDETPPSLTVAPFEGTLAVGDRITGPDGYEGRIIAGPACNGLDIAKPDGLDLPTFLKREKPSPTSLALGADTSKWARDRAERREAKAAKAKAPAPAKSGTYDELKANGALRSEPVATPVEKPPVSRKAAKAKTAPTAAKRSSKAPAKAAGASGGKTNIGAVARTAILRGKSNEEALAAVMKAFPDCSSNAGCMAWYRNKLKKEGYLRQDGTTSVKGEDFLHFS